MGKIVNLHTRCYSYAEMERDLYRLEKRYEDIASVYSIGETLDGRELYCLRMASGQEQAPKKSVVIQAAIHGREWKNSQLIMAMAEQFLKSHYDDILWEGIPYRQLLRHYDVHILPMVNPDGVQISQFGLMGITDEEVRKQVRETWEIQSSTKQIKQMTKRWKGNASGVDLNRNFPEGFISTEHLKRPGEAGYTGAQPFSEKESIALWRYVSDIKPALTVNYHSTGQEIFYRNYFWGLEHISRQTGYPLVGETKKANGSFGDMLTQGKYNWCTIETGIGRAPIGHIQIYFQWMRHKHLLPLLLATVPHKFHESSTKNIFLTE